MSRVVHFEIHASNPETLIPFYAGLLGWKFTKWEGPVDYWMIQTGAEGEPGINGGLMRRQGPSPSATQAVNGFVCTVNVINVDASVTRANELGGSLALAKMAIPGVGWLAYVKDLDGNLLGLMQPDPSAI